MSKERRESNQPALSFTKMLSFLLICVALGVVCLLQWGSPQPFSRIDLFSGGALLLSILFGLEQISFSLALPPSGSVRGEVFGMSYDPQMAMWLSLLAVAEYAVFLDYGHWRLLPQLEQPPLQAAGLALYLVSVVVLRRADTRLAQHFKAAGAGRTLITEGAFRRIRHPRYAALVLSKLAFALAFASLIGWVLLTFWVLVVNRRIRKEEPHLQEVFGDAYASYKGHTARLLPFLY